MIKKLFCLLLIGSLSLAPMAFAVGEEDAASTDTEQPAETTTTDPSTTDGEGADASLTAPSIKSDAAVVMDADNGQILYHKNMNNQKAPASITKLMTALLVLQKGGSMEDTITVSEDALTGTKGTTTIDLVAGEEVTVQDMLYAMLINSANDAANVLAEYVSGTQEEFVAKMNSTAESLGCKATNFVNASGLDDDKQQTTAYDMALIARTLFDYDEFLDICGAISYTMEPTNKYTSTRTFDSKISFQFETSQFYSKDVVAAKTGWTSSANHTLVTFANRENHKLVVVNLDCEAKYQKFQDVLDMLEYSYGAYEAVTISAADLYAAAVKSLKDSGAVPRESSFSDQTVYLTGQTTIDDLSYTFTAGDAPTGSVVVANGGDGESTLISFAYTLEASGTDAAATKDSAKDKTSPFRIILRIIIVLLIAFLAFYGYIIHVNRERARRRRRRERDRKRRERRSGSSDYTSRRR